MTTEHTFISFSRSVKHRKRSPPEVLFHLFLDSQNMRRLSCACPFQLVNGLEMTSTQYKFNPFLDWARLLMKNEYVDLTWSIGSLLYYFILFQTWETNLRKITYGFFFLSLFKLSKYEKDSVLNVVKLIKTSNSEKIVHHDKTKFHLC